jgi:TRAP-type C4-dicarboxylate transport system permease small subunit
MKTALNRLQRALDRLSGLGAALLLPLALLLAAQWPLRDWVSAGSRQANDLAQCLFALAMAIAVHHAGRRRAHMAADALAAGYPARLRERLQRIGHALCVLPCCGFALLAGAPQAARSVLGLEAFPDTFNPGYFVVQGSAWLLALLLALQAGLDLLLGSNREAR